jgi:hypothetical protein
MRVLPCEEKLASGMEASSGSDADWFGETSVDSRGMSASSWKCPKELADIVATVQRANEDYVVCFLFECLMQMGDRQYARAKQIANKTQL